MVWIVLAILVVGYFIVQAINGNKQAGSVSKLLPIGQRIKMVRELTDKLQTYLGNDYKKELDEYKQLRHHKHEKYAWKTWDKDHEANIQKGYDNFCKLIELNTRLCQRFTKDDQKLLDQLTDWGTYMEQFRDMRMIHTGNDGYIDAGLDLPSDEAGDAERRGIIKETYDRMINRAKVEGVYEKRFEPSL